MITHYYQILLFCFKYNGNFIKEYKASMWFLYIVHKNRCEFSCTIANCILSFPVLLYLHKEAFL